MIALGFLPHVLRNNASDWGLTIAYVAGAGVILNKTPLGRVVAFVFRRLFGEPGMAMLRRHVAAAVNPEIARIDKRIDELDRRDSEHRERSEQQQLATDLLLAQLRARVLTLREG